MIGSIGLVWAVWRREFAVAAAIAVTALVASCGGGDNSVDPASESGTGREHAAALPAPAVFVPPIPIPADASSRGMWSSVYNWPVVAVHATLLPDGRVLTFGSSATGQQGANAIYDVWDSTLAPDAGHLTLPNGTGTDIFCSSNLLLAPLSAQSTASVFIAGGDNWNGTSTTNTANPNSNLFDVTTRTLTRKTNMQSPRWYSTSTTLLNGEVYIQGGSGGNQRPEVRGLDGSFRLLSGADTSGMDSNYPRNYVAPDGRIFGYDSNGWMYYVNPTGTGTFTTAGLLNSSYASWTGSSAMFRPGRILHLSGSSSNALVIDINSGAPVLTPTQSLSSQRAWVNATILPNGQVLATSGSQIANALVGVNTKAEIWDPVTGQWMQGPAAVRPRLYHSNALLLPDASVLVSGGGATVPVGTGPSDNLNAEIYYPPYLFTAAGQRAPRPVVTAVPDWADIGKVIAVDVSNATSVSRVTLVKTGASTHSYNMDQRFVDLTFAANGLHLSVQMPSHASDATPGYYQLFVFDQAGVPSVARVVRIGPAAAANPAITPTLTNPGAQTTERGSAVNLALTATDPNGDVLAFSASGLPAGLTINSATGQITGAPTVAGTYDVVLTVSDGVNVASASFSWVVTFSNAVVLDPLPAINPVQTGLSSSFTATTHGGTNVLYRWNFGDGTGDTAWSSAATVTHNFSSPGTYNVTLSVTDDSQVVQTRSFVQTVYLPSTANKPSASSNIAIETPATGNARLWVVNQDNDSVSAFDTVTQAKLGEVSVGSAPRSVAVAANGLVWVTNKRSDSISVINPATRAIVKTIALPRASQPFGVAMSPTAGQAFVVLEATGQLLKFDSVSYALLGTLSVGANPRHLSITADGASVYVSRFVTPALPGESTATVTTTPSAGAEVVVVSAAGMSFTRTIVLQHSDKFDLENQGRGIPNYLGAATISPDGTQAWVPSKQDNIKRGTLRDGTGLNFQNTVRAVSSRIVMATNQEDLSKRVDHDNSSVASAAVFDSRGVYLFVALESSREVAVVDAHGGFQVMRFDVGRAPQGLAISSDGNTLYVNNFMDRSVGVYDLRPLLSNGQLSVPTLVTLTSVGTEALAANVLLGKQHFYDARDTRLARDRYMSCASCHNDGGADGRVWDFTGQGEGLRNTIALRGRSGAQGPLHWSGNFDEVQDFEGQIRTLAGGTGLMSDAAFNTGTRSQPLGDPKAGASTDLDALAAYVVSLATSEPSPFRGADGSLSAAATAGQVIFQTQNCATCHGGSAFTNSGAMGLQNIGTLKPSSGQRLGGPLTGIDIPTLRDVWRTGPYLHDGSAPTLEDAVLAHNAVTITSADLTSLVAYLREIGSEESVAPGTVSSLTGSVSAATTGVDLTAVGTGDWAHWGDGGVPGLARKSTGGAQISDYTLVQGGTVASYGNDLRSLSWSDGAPTVSSAVNTNGLYVSGQGNGFSLTVPASTAIRTVTVYVGGWASSGTFRAHLSDSSAADYTDTTVLATSQYTRAYAITYSAASTGQQLVLTWTQATAPGNITLNGVALTGAAGGPNHAPTLVTPAAQTGTQGQALVFALSASDVDGDTLSYSATGLPAGLNVNASSGVISGTPSAAGSNSVSVTVQDGRGGNATANFVWTIQAPANLPPTVVTPTTQTSTQGQAVTVGISASDPNNDTLSYSAVGLPAGLSINAATGVISGTPTTVGSYIAVVTVQDGRGGSATASFSWVVQATPPANQPPTINTPAAQTSTQTQAVALTLTASDPDGDTLSFSAVGLPAGLSINTVTGAISGTPTTVGSSNVVVTVSDGRSGSATASFTWTIQAAPPGSLGGTVSTATTTVNLTTVGAGDWAHWGDGGVPGLTRKAAGGSQISAYTLVQGGNPASYNNDLRALSWTDGAPTASNAANTNGLYMSGLGNGFSVTVPASTTSRTVTIYLGGWASSGSFRAHLSDGSAADFTDTSTTATGQYARNYTITYAAASAGKQLVLSWVQASAAGNITLNGVALGALVTGPNNPPTVVTPAAQTGTQGQAVTLAISASDVDGDPLSYIATGLPAGLTINATTGVISGTPTTVGNSSTSVTVQDGRGGSAVANFSWVIQAPANLPPTIVTPAAQTSTQGQALVLAISASDPNNDTLSYSATGLPAGLAINATSGVISGTPTAVASTTTVVTVQDGRGGVATATFVWAVQAQANRAPTIATPATRTSTQGQAATLAISASDPDGDALTYSAVGLPTGLSINAASGLISGTPTTLGTSIVVVTVQDGRGGSASATFNWTVQAATPGSLTGVISTVTTAANLTTQGAGDWAHWGDGGVPGLTRKAAGGSQIGAYALVKGGSVAAYGDDLRALSWTDGAPTATSTTNTKGVYISGQGNGFSVTLPAGTTSRTVTVYVGGWASSGTFKAHLSDGSAADFTDTTTAATSQYVRSYTLTFAAAAASKQLVLTWTQASAAGNVTLNGVALSP